MQFRGVGSESQSFEKFLFGLGHLPQHKIVFRERLMGPRRIRIRRLQRVNRLLGKQTAGPTEIIKQVRIVGVLGQRGLEIFYRWLQLPGPDLRDPQCRLLPDLLEMRNRRGIIA
jgi:hypothetical protein